MIILILGKNNDFNTPANIRKMKQRGGEFQIEDLHTNVNVIYSELTRYSVSDRNMMQSGLGILSWLTKINMATYKTSLTILYLTSLNEFPTWIHH